MTATGRPPTALVADDEPLLRERLVAHLARLWPELVVVAQARNGREAIELFDEHHPDVAFLDVRMPGLGGIEAARAIGERAAIVFVTAFEEYAVQAFERGAIDYLVKPFDDERLAQTVARLRARLAAASLADGTSSAAALMAGEAATGAAGAAGAAGGAGTTRTTGTTGAAGAEAAEAAARDAAARLHDLLERLQAQVGSAPAEAPRRYLQWIRASVGPSLRLIPVDEVVFLRSDEKYTLVVWDGGEALIRKTIRELAEELDPERFVQIHRSVIVALGRIAQVVRRDNETAEVHLRGRTEVLPVSRSWLHLFRQM
jgi:DNA-binding LytR/AlgR family response regulator